MPGKVLGKGILDFLLLTFLPVLIVLRVLNTDPC